MLINRSEGFVRWVGWFYRVVLGRSMAQTFNKWAEVEQAIEKFKERFKVYVIDEETGEVIEKHV